MHFLLTKYNKHFSHLQISWTAVEHFCGSYSDSPYRMNCVLANYNKPFYHLQISSTAVKFWRERYPWLSYLLKPFRSSDRILSRCAFLSSEWRNCCFSHTYIIYQNIFTTYNCFFADDHVLLSTSRDKLEWIFFQHTCVLKIWLQVGSALSIMCTLFTCCAKLLHMKL